MLRHATIVLALGLTASLAGDPLVPTAQSRLVQCTAYAEDFNGPGDDSDGQSAADFGPFDAAVNANVDLGTALGDGGATLSSQIGPNAISASGGFFGTAESYDFGAFASGTGGVDFSVSFDLAEPSAYRLSGYLGAFDNGSVSVELSGVHSEFAFGPSEQVDVEQSGMLPAGSYTLTIDGSGNADAFDFGFDYGSGEYDITLVVGASGPGGETPDGKDVPGTPLLLSKRGSTLYELSWGVSCRPDDTDYAIYEGAIGGAVSEMIPVVCSTGGARTRTVGSADSVAYLVVPNDGANEGSYGDDSAGLQRPTSLTACAPQVLAAPTCP